MAPKNQKLTHQGPETRFEKVQVVVPVYNDEDTIGDCLRALLVQDGFSPEIIVVDAGSQDTSSQVVQKIIGEGTGRVRMLSSKQRLNSSEARNLGLAEVDGNYVCFVDSDVLVPRNWLVSILPYVRDGKSLASAEVVGGYTSSIGRKFGLVAKPHLVPWSITSANLACTTTVIRDLGGFDESIERAEDFELSIRAREKGMRLHNVQSVVCDHRDAAIDETRHKIFSSGRSRLDLFLRHPLNLELNKEVLASILFPFVLLVVVGVGYFTGYLPLCLIGVLAAIILWATHLGRSRFRLKRGFDTVGVIGYYLWLQLLFAGGCWYQVFYRISRTM